MIYDFKNYDLRDLFKMRDADDILKEYGLGISDEARDELDAEINRRADATP